MTDPIREALQRLLDAEAHIHVAGPEYEQARDAARVALAAEPPAPAKHVATLHVSDFRGYENYDFQHLVDLPPGRYELFTTCTVQPPAPAVPDEVRAAFAELERRQENLHYFRDLRKELAAEPPAPDPREALAARPLLEAVARLGDRIGQHTVAEITTISDRAAAWLAENPPGQPVAIEPRGCPTPGACSCVEAPAPADPSDFQTLQGIALDMVESLRPIVLPEILGVLRRAIKQAPAPAPAADGERDHVPGAGNMVPAAYAARLRQCPTHGQLPANAWGCPECLRELREGLARLRGSAVDGEREEREELATFLTKEAVAMDYWFERDTAKKVRRAAALLRQPAPAPVPVADGASSPTPEEIALLWDASNSPSVFAGLVLARWGSQPPAPAPAAPAGGWSGVAVDCLPPISPAVWVGTPADGAPQVVPTTSTVLTVEELADCMPANAWAGPEGYSRQAFARHLLDHRRIGPLLRGDGAAAPKRVVLPEDPPFWRMPYAEGPGAVDALARAVWAAARAEVERQQQGGQADG